VGKGAPVNLPFRARVARAVPTAGLACGAMVGTLRFAHPYDLRPIFGVSYSAESV
jgi:hypothetical protein